MTEYTAKKVILKDANNNYLIPYTENELPSQRNNSGKFLTTDGTNPSWANVQAGHNLFDIKWTDHILYDENWLRSDLFTWQSGATYSNAYNHLVNDIDEKVATTEVLNDLTITYYIADDGHRICLADQEEVVDELYSTYGIAWYYILDTENSRFKLPRTQFSFRGIRDSVGANINESIPNITGSWAYMLESNEFWVEPTGAVYRTDQQGNGADGQSGHFGIYHIDASRSSSAYQNGAPVQERATQMYLYFYVGGFTPSATQQTAGLNSALLNQKVDKSDLSQIYPVIETYINGSSWYRIYAKDENGYWCEQGGLCPTSGDTSRTNTLLKNYRDANYTILITENSTTATANNTACGPVWILSKTNSSFTIFDDMWGSGCFWEAKGYLALGEV